MSRRLSGPPLPLFNAVANGDYDQVVRLVENGARVTDRNTEGLTCIMQPQYFTPDHFDADLIFDFLVDEGLSVDALTLTGQTALHLAVEASNFTLVKLLTRKNAKIVVDGEGNNPLFVAAMNTAHPEIYNHLINYTALDDRKMTKDAIFLWETTIYLNRLDNSVRDLKNTILMEPVIEEEDDPEPNPAYGSIREARTSEECRRMDRDQTYSVYQCFIIRERILGRDHPEVRHKLFSYISRIPFSSEAFARERPLIRYMISLNLKHDPDAVVTIFSHLVERIRALILGVRNNEIRYETEHTLRLLCSHVLVILTETLEKAPQDTEKTVFYDWCKALIEFGLEIICKIDTIGLDFTDVKRLEYLELDLGRFVKAANALKVPIFHSLKFVAKSHLVPLFLSKGAKIYAKDQQGETVLAALLLPYDAQSAQSNPYYVHIDYMPLVRELVAKGARVFVRKNGHSVYEVLKAARGYSPLINFSAMRSKLQDLAAAAVEKNLSMKYLEKHMPTYKMSPELTFNVKEDSTSFQRDNPSNVAEPKPQAIN
ncbi:unnamed protein product [Caenorhabditis auriculariae]|uniref:Uncharacterized protein n=1 Tax=Caenorhabditis auriculariae TaxID=2777116 RepID=A0A8S1H432_9PELO|nr:unnamed protein product [Caenorhabditis auriculariae]